jgi:uncharacterized membrane protein SpoIIM required for sporulation
VSIGRAVFGAFRRNSSAISIVVIAAFVVMILSTMYYMLVFTPAQFAQKPEVQGYENAVQNVVKMDDWARTQYYWSNNLMVAGVCAIETPMYFGFNTAVATNYMIGMSITYNYYFLESENVLAFPAMISFPAMIFIHGLLELTGIYIIAAVSLRMAWNFWRGLGGLVAITDKEGKNWSWKLAKREVIKHRGTIKMLLSDFVILFSIGFFLVFLAAPIEAYVSPSVGSIFLLAPAVAAFFLAAVGLFYALIVARGFNRMRGDLKFVWNEIRLGLKRKWRPAHLSLLIFIIFFALMLLRVIS